MRMLYRYPQAEFPYEEFVRRNAERSKMEPEFELWDTGILHEHRYFDITIEYAKVVPDDFLIRATTTNRGPEAASLHFLPTLWFRNTWTWGEDKRRPNVRFGSDHSEALGVIQASHERSANTGCIAKERDLFSSPKTKPTGTAFRLPNTSPFVKDGINDFVVRGKAAVVNPERMGTKAAAHYRSRSARRNRLRFGCDCSGSRNLGFPAFDDFDRLVATATDEADEFYDALTPSCLSNEHRAIQRQALAGMLWTQAILSLLVEQWLEGDPAQPPPPPERKHGPQLRVASSLQRAGHVDARQMGISRGTRRGTWRFHCIPLALVDPHFAKSAARSHRARMVPAPQRPGPRLRMEFRRRQSAGDWLGRVARLQDRAATERQRRSRFPRNRLPQTAHRIYLVGEPEGFRGK